MRSHFILDEPNALLGCNLVSGYSIPAGLMADYASLNVCSRCSKSYKRPEHLRRHQLSHSAERPYECTFCRSTFQRSDVLKRHLKTCDTLADDEVNSSEPCSKRPALSNPSPQQEHGLSFLEPHKYGPQLPPPGDQGAFPHDSSGPSFDNIAGWISCGLSKNDFDDPSETWQDFLNFTSGTQTPHAASDDGDEDDGSLRFLANFTSKTGLVSSFDCGTLEQRWRVAFNFANSVAESSAIKPSVASGSPELSIVFEGDATTSDTNKEHSARTVVGQWLSDPLALKSHEIITSIREIVLHKSRNSCVTFSWSDTVQETCVRFFSPMNIRQYIYFYWAIWHPNVNIVHKPTFDPSSSKPELIAAMSLMGACVSPEPKDLEAAKRWFNCVEEMVFNDDDLCDDTPLPVCRDTGELQWRREKLRALQAAYMVCLYQNWEGASSSKRRIRRYRYSTVVAAARDTGIHNSRHPDYSRQNLCDFSFSGFAVREELIRVFLWIFLLDTAFVIFNNLPPRMVIREMKMSTANPEASFQAMTAEECFSILQQENQNDALRPKIAFEFKSAFEMLYQAHIDDSLSTALADLGPLNLFAMTSALHSLIFHYQNSFSCQGSLDAIQQAHQTWGKIWNIYMTRFSQESRHSPVISSMRDLDPDDMWKRIGFTRHASEYWLLGKFMVGRLSKSNEHVDGVVGVAGPVQSLASISGTESVSPLLEQYDQTSMQQINVLISDFQKVYIR
jgi:hypothetical protein